MRADWLDLRDPAFYQRGPHDVWDRLRGTEGLVRDRNGFVAIARFADVLAAERKPPTSPAPAATASAGNRASGR